MARLPEEALLSVAVAPRRVRDPRRPRTPRRDPVAWDFETLRCHKVQGRLGERTGANPTSPAFRVNLDTERSERLAHQIFLDIRTKRLSSCPTRLRGLGPHRDELTNYLLVGCAIERRLKAASPEPPALGSGVAGAGTGGLRTVAPLAPSSLSRLAATARVFTVHCVLPSRDRTAQLAADRRLGELPHAAFAGAVPGGRDGASRGLAALEAGRTAASCGGSGESILFGNLSRSPGFSSSSACG